MASSLTPALSPEQQVDNSPANEENADANTIFYLATRALMPVTSVHACTLITWYVVAGYAALIVDLGTAAVDARRKMVEKLRYLRRTQSLIPVSHIFDNTPIE